MFKEHSVAYENYAQSLASVFEATHDPEDFIRADSEFQKAVAKFPDKWELYIHAGDICKRLKKYDEAFKYWDKAEELGTTFMDGKYAKASCYENSGEYENAYKVWSELAAELLSKGYDVEAEMPRNQAKLCLEKLNT